MFVNVRTAQTATAAKKRNSIAVNFREARSLKLKQRMQRWRTAVIK